MLKDSPDRPWPTKVQNALSIQSCAGCVSWVSLVKSSSSRGLPRWEATSPQVNRLSSFIINRKVRHFCPLRSAETTTCCKLFAPHLRHCCAPWTIGSTFGSVAQHPSLLAVACVEEVGRFGSENSWSSLRAGVGHKVWVSITGSEAVVRSLLISTLGRSGICQWERVWEDGWSRERLCDGGGRAEDMTSIWSRDPSQSHAKLAPKLVIPRLSPIMINHWVDDYHPWDSGRFKFSMSRVCATFLLNYTHKNCFQFWQKENMKVDHWIARLTDDRVEQDQLPWLEIIPALPVFPTGRWILCSEFLHICNNRDKSKFSHVRKNKISHRLSRLRIQV